MQCAVESDLSDYLTRVDDKGAKEAWIEHRCEELRDSFVESLSSSIEGDSAPDWLDDSALGPCSRSLIDEVGELMSSLWCDSKIERRLARLQLAFLSADPAVVMAASEELRQLVADEWLRSRGHDQAVRDWRAAA